MTEFCERGDLGRFIKRQLSLLPEKVVLKVFSQICLGLAYLHSERILHRDIKSTNIFLKKDMRVRIGDFGITRRLPPNKTHLTELIGTPCYLSPELLLQGAYDDKNDVWALGCLLYELCKQSKPFNAKREQDLQRMIVKSESEPPRNRLGLSASKSKPDKKTSPPSTRRSSTTSSTACSSRTPASGPASPRSSSCH